MAIFLAGEFAYEGKFWFAALMIVSAGLAYDSIKMSRARMQKKTGASNDSQ